MLALISFILVIIGCVNWFSIGILQFDFVAGIFGSQSNIFSRLIYTLVGIAAIIMLFNFVTNKGKFIVSFKKADKEFEEMKAEKEAEKRRKALATESSEEFSLSKALKKESEKTNTTNKYSTESGEDYSRDKHQCSSKDCNCKSHKEDE